LKDPADHYNITVSIMVKRDHEAHKTSDPYNGHGLSHLLDKGFPYDDGDNSIND
jgi:hypothetical protein